MSTNNIGLLCRTCKNWPRLDLSINLRDFILLASKIKMKPSNLLKYKKFLQQVLTDYKLVIANYWSFFSGREVEAADIPGPDPAVHVDHPTEGMVVLYKI